MRSVITNVELTPRVEADDMRGYTGVKRERFVFHPSRRICGSYRAVSKGLQGMAVQVQLSPEELRGDSGFPKQKRSDLLV